MKQNKKIAPFYKMFSLSVLLGLLFGGGAKAQERQPRSNKKMNRLEVWQKNSRTPCFLNTVVSVTDNSVIIKDWVTHKERTLCIDEKFAKDSIKAPKWFLNDTFCNHQDGFTPGAIALPYNTIDEYLMPGDTILLDVKRISNYQNLDFIPLDKVTLFVMDRDEILQRNKDVNVSCNR